MQKGSILLLSSSLQIVTINIIIADSDSKPSSYKIEPKFIIGDLRDIRVVEQVLENVDEIYQLAADMGGAGFVFTGEHDADIMHNSGLINLNVVMECVKKNVKKVFYSSSACMYPAGGKCHAMDCSRV